MIYVTKIDPKVVSKLQRFSTFFPVIVNTDLWLICAHCFYIKFALLNAIWIFVIMVVTNYWIVCIHPQVFKFGPEME